MDVSERERYLTARVDTLRGDKAVLRAALGTMRDYCGRLEVALSVYERFYGDGLPDETRLRSEMNAKEPRNAPRVAESPDDGPAARVGLDPRTLGEVFRKADLRLEAQRLREQVSNLRAELSQNFENYREIRRKYDELLMAVETVHQGESRHQTALRYIRKAEARGLNQAQSQQREEFGGSV